MHSSTVGTSSTAGSAGRMARLISNRFTLYCLLGFTPLDHLATKDERDLPVLFVYRYMD